MLQVCEGLSMRLSSIHSSEEEHFIVNGIRQSGDYSAGPSTGGAGSRAAGPPVVDGPQPMAYQRWSPRNVSLADSNGTCVWGCSGNLHRFHRNLVDFLVNTQMRHNGRVRVQAQAGLRGVSSETRPWRRAPAVSPANYPATYDNGLDYWVNIVGTEGTRLNQDRDRNRNKKRSKLKAEPESKAGSESEPAQVESGSGTRAIPQSGFACDNSRGRRATRDNAAVACGRADQACYTQFLFGFNKMRCELFRQLRDEGSGERYCGVTRALGGGGRAASLHALTTKRKTVLKNLRTYNFSTQGRVFVEMARGGTNRVSLADVHLKEGVIQSPNYPEFLLPNLECVFNILAPTQVGVNPLKYACSQVTLDQTWNAR
ncbi:hypothetical protein EVAR_102013_1 [Eumeta japonica]|uniref:Uncharacterized protein n=1 Tax=Eumeta variegata TaxID=151549 RepID=A0A4C2ACU1_EUMVA|nr:hypothetical protein EVAR_102013_1 [Eumeta japonica]